MIEADKIQERRQSFARQWSRTYRLYAHEADDFASYCVLLWIERPVTNWNRDFKHLAIDYIRGRTQYSRSEKVAHGLTDALDEDEHAALTLDPLQVIEDRELGQILRSKALDPDLRCMLVLFYEYGFTQNEIADCFGLTPSGVSQRLTGVQERIQKKVEQHLELPPQGGDEYSVQAPLPNRPRVQRKDEARSKNEGSFPTRSF